MSKENSKKNKIRKYIQSFIAALITAFFVCFTLTIGFSKQEGNYDYNEDTENLLNLVKDIKLNSKDTIEISIKLKESYRMSINQITHENNYHDWVIEINGDINSVTKYLKTNGESKTKLKYESEEDYYKHTKFCDEILPIIIASITFIVVFFIWYKN